MISQKVKIYKGFSHSVGDERPYNFLEEFWIISVNEKV